MKIQVAGGREVSYLLEGKKDAPCVMLAHGVALDMHLWDDFAATLAPDFSVLRYDSRGHGGSPVGSEPFGLDDLADDAVSLMDALGIQKVHFVGLSLGGMVGMGLALNHADRLESVAFCNARADATDDYRANWDQRTRLVQEGGIATIADATVSRWFTPEYPSRDPEAMARIKAMVLATSVDGYCMSARALKGLNYGHRLQGNTVRALFLTGEKDPGAPAAIVAAEQRNTPNSAYVELPATAHISVIETPDGFTNAILDFIRKA